jgi:hypothetical protein
MELKQTLLITLIAVSCADNPTPRNPGPDKPPPHHEDHSKLDCPDAGHPGLPNLETRFVNGELRIMMRFSMGGSSFELVGTERVKNHTDVKLRITSPPDGAIVTQSFEDQEVTVALPVSLPSALPGAQPGTVSKGCGPLRLLLQRKTRNKHYETEPEFRCVKIVSAPDS